MGKEASGEDADPIRMLPLEQVPVTSTETEETHPRLLEALGAARSREGEAPKREQEENVPSREVARVGRATGKRMASWMPTRRA